MRALSVLLRHDVRWLSPSEGDLVRRHPDEHAAGARFGLQLAFRRVRRSGYCWNDVDGRGLAATGMVGVRHAAVDHTAINIRRGGTGRDDESECGHQSGDAGNSGRTSTTWF